MTGMGRPKHWPPLSKFEKRFLLAILVFCVIGWLIAGNFQ